MENDEELDALADKVLVGSRVTGLIEEETENGDRGLLEDREQNRNQGWLLETHV